MAPREKKSQCMLFISTFLYSYWRGKSKKIKTMWKNVDDISDDTILYEKPKKFP